MSCTTCGPTLPVATFVFPTNGPCTNCDPQNCGNNIFSAACIYYAGPALMCIETDPNERLDSILQKIDAKVCLVAGADPYPSYDVACLAPVNTQREFVEKISLQFCTLLTNYNAFVNVTFPNALETINTRIDLLDAPNISACSEIGFTSTDTLSEAITKVANFACIIAGSSLDLSSVNWNQCSVVGTLPVSLAEGFNFVIDRICSLQAQITGVTALPVFDNTGTCLPSPTDSDSLESTVIKIRTRLCTTPTFNPSGYTFGCYTGTLSAASTLDQTIQAILSQTSINTQNTITFNPAQFTVSLVNPAQPCLGKTVSITGASFTDRLVAATSTDSTPGVLQDKLVAGSGINFDYTNPAKVTISAVNLVDEKVKVNNSDPSPGYLADKIVGTGGVVTMTVPVLSNQMKVTATIDYGALLDIILDLLEEGGDQATRLCNIVANCPSPCAAPTNVQAIQV